jgi:hypothetical protein
MRGRSLSRRDCGRGKREAIGKAVVFRRRDLKRREANERSGGPPRIHNAVGVAKSLAAAPGVARSAQPRALLHSPFGTKRQIGALTSCHRSHFILRVSIKEAAALAAKEASHQAGKRFTSHRRLPQPVHSPSPAACISPRFRSSASCSKRIDPGLPESAVCRRTGTSTRRSVRPCYRTLPP